MKELPETATHGDVEAIPYTKKDEVRLLETMNFSEGTTPDKILRMLDGFIEKVKDGKHAVWYGGQWVTHLSYEETTKEGEPVQYEVKGAVIRVGPEPVAIPDGTPIVNGVPQLPLGENLVAGGELVTDANTPAMDPDFSDQDVDTDEDDKTK